MVEAWYHDDHFEHTKCHLSKGLVSILLSIVNAILSEVDTRLLVAVDGQAYWRLMEVAAGNASSVVVFDCYGMGRTSMIALDSFGMTAAAV